MEDPPLQLAQLGARLEPELVPQTGAGIRVEIESLRLPPAAVEGEHRLCLETLPFRMGGGEAAQLRQQVVVAAERQLRLDPLLERDQAQLLQALCFRPRELLVGEVAVGLPRQSPSARRSNEAASAGFPSRGGPAL